MNRNPALRRGLGVLACVVGLGVTSMPVAAAADVARDSRARAPHADPWWFSAIGLDEAHRTATGKGVTIAVLDSGIQRDVPALRGADVRLMPSPCLANLPGEGRPVVYEPGERGIHGSAMASLVAGGGYGPNGQGSGIMGAAPDARILFYDIDDQRNSVGAGLTCDTARAADTYRDAVDAGADIIVEASAGSPDLFVTREVSKIVAENDVVIVGSNDDSSPREGIEQITGVSSPAAIPGVVSVNAFDRNVEAWEYSKTVLTRSDSFYPNWFAPVVSSVGVDMPIPGSYVGATADTVQSGTSLPAPLVGGILALVQERWPEATPNQLIQHLVHYTSRYRDPETRGDLTWRDGTGFGPVSATLMLQHDPTVWPDENPLLNGPEAVAEDYPMSLAEQPAAPEEPSSPATDEPAAPSQERVEAASQPAADDASGAADEQQDEGSDGAPVALLASAVIGLALLVGAVLLVRRRARDETTDEARGTTTGARDDLNDHTGV